MKGFRQYLVEERNVPKYKYHDYLHETDPEWHQEHWTQAHHFETSDYIPFTEDQKEQRELGESVLVESVEDNPHNDKQLIFRHNGPKATSAATALVVPKHMWVGGKQKGGGHFDGMDARNDMRAKVYGGENRPPLGLSQMEDIHKKALDEHFTKLKGENDAQHLARQTHIETAALGRLREAGHLSRDALTTDVGEKTDTVHHEHDDQGRSYIARSAKGVAGHAVYTSGHKAGGNEQHHIVTTCIRANAGCSGGINAHGLANTLKGSCFAPKAEHQYVGAAVKRAAHEQAKFDPAMTKDWILAHTHSMRKTAELADKSNKRFLFRPNVVDETDRTSRHVAMHLNEQRDKLNKPPIQGNSYGKTDELHDPEHHWHVTKSNVGPKVKHGMQITENRGRDENRVRETITATHKTGKDYTNIKGNKTPPKNSYMVTNAQRGSKLAQDFEKHVTHAKYWSTGRDTRVLKPEQKKQGPEGHYDGKGNPTTPELAHYGHITITSPHDGNSHRYDYQKQHVLHPRLVETADGKGKKHMIPTDSRFMDHKFLPKDEHRFKSSNGKLAGAINITTPTTSTSEVQHHSIFTHDVSPAHIEHAKTHNGEYEIDNPHHQEAASTGSMSHWGIQRGGNEYKNSKEYVPPEAPAENAKKARVKKAIVKSKLSLEQKRLAKHFG